MFATGMPPLAIALFSAVSLVIAVPSGVQFFAWIATMWRGHVQLSVPMLFALGFLLIFLLGGITGVMVAVLPFDWQVTDSYFVVAHFHYVLNGAVVFPIFGALYYWMPKMTGRLLHERMGKISFWVMFVGFNITFFPMHILGFLGMPRRVYTYADGLGWGGLNAMISVGSAIFGLGAALTLGNWLWSWRYGERASANPWGADSLEWATSSPPPDHNFTTIPVVTSRHPLWEEAALPDAVPVDDEGRSLAVEGAYERSTPITSGLDTRPHERLDIPSDTPLPFLVAAGISLLFVALLVNGVWVGVGAAILAVGAVLRWAWRTDEALA
jgi:heme/copper-type cytochrome/quinol oxidase subunit 1